MGWMSEDSPATLCPSPTIADKLSPMILCPWTPSTGKQATSQWTGELSTLGIAMSWLSSRQTLQCPRLYNLQSPCPL